MQPSVRGVSAACSIALHETFGGFGLQFHPWSSNQIAVASGQHFGVTGYGAVYFLSMGVQTLPNLQVDGWIPMSDGCFDVAYSEFHPEICLAATGDGVKVLQARECSVLHTHHGHQGEVHGVQWDTFSKQKYASASEDTTVQVWDGELPTSAAACLNVLRGHTKEVYEATWNPRVLGTILSCSGDGMWRCWDVRAGSASVLVGVPPNQPTMLLSCDWNRYIEHQFATSAVDHRICVWDARHARAPISVLLGHEGAIRRVRYSPHSPSLILSAGYDFRVCVWDLANHNGVKTSADPMESPYLRQRYEHHREFAIGVDWSLHRPGVVASSGWDGVVSVWPLGSSPRILRDSGAARLPPLPKVFPPRATPRNIRHAPAPLGTKKIPQSILDASTRPRGPSQVPMVRAPAYPAPPIPTSSKE